MGAKMSVRNRSSITSNPNPKDLFDDLILDRDDSYCFMASEVKKSSTTPEFETEERCYIAEIANDSGDKLVSIARARVWPGVTTTWHKLNGVTERYIIVSGHGSVELGDHDPMDVCEGDVVRIPANTPQKIKNTGKLDLIFYCICSPPYRKGCYVNLE
jgi:mannose-6-phosphate isomerase-like protein (cupin superfamily)